MKTPTGTVLIVFLESSYCINYGAKETHPHHQNTNINPYPLNFIMIKATNKINLRLEEDPSDHPRHLTIQSNHIIAIGGENGNITALSLDDANDINSNTNNNKSFQIIQRYDDAVKALAFSNDGKRVAVGYEDGSVDIYVYSNDDMVNNDNIHPFISNKAKAKNRAKVGDCNDDNDTGNDDDDDDAVDFLSSQFDDDHIISNNIGQKPTFTIKHRFEASIRHLQFRPNLNNNNRNNSKQNYYLAIASESSPGFMIVDVTSHDSFKKFFDDDATSTYNQGGVRSISFSPDGKICTALGMDGRISFWCTDGDDPKLDWDFLHCDGLKAVDRVDTGGFADIGDKSLYPVWSHCGNIVGIPGSNELKFRKREDTTTTETTGWYVENRMILNFDKEKKEGFESSIVGLAFDPTNDGYAVTSSRNGNVALWRFNYNRKENEPEGKFVTTIYNSESMCTHILWNKDNKTNAESLYLALENGSMLTFHGRDNFIPKEKSTSKEELTQNLTEHQDIFDSDSLIDDLSLGSETEIGLNTQSQGQALSSKIAQKKSNEDEDDDTRNDEKDTAFAKAQANPFVADEAEDDAGNLHADVGDEDSQFDDILASQKDSDANLDTMQPTSNNNYDNDDDNFAIDDDVAEDNYDSYHNQPHIAEIQPQPSFAPSATPLASRTILCWNHIGVITSRDDNDRYRSIDISFTDAMKNRPVSFTDNMRFVLGSLGEQGAIFATDLVEEVNDDDVDDNVINVLDGLNHVMSDATKNIVKQSERKRGGRKDDRSTGSCIYFHRFHTFGQIKNKDWFITLPEGEKVLGCATGEGWNAVVTSRRFLRTFTSGGVQGPMVWLKGEPVTTVGRGRFLAVFYHESAPLSDGTQKLGYSIYDGLTMNEISSGSVAAISPGSSLTWAGFSSDLALSVMDDDGMLSMLMAMKPNDRVTDNFSFSWIPMLDTFGMRKSNKDSFWPISIQNGKLICVPLNDSLYPNPARRPLTTSLQLKMPLVHDTIDKNNRLEEVAARATLALEHKGFLNDFNTNHCSGDADALQAEYDDICAKVDKVTLKLLIKMIETSKVEAALDLVHRLHLEQSFEIAMAVANRSSHRKLSSKIFDIKEARFAFESDDENSYESHSSNVDNTAFSDDHTVESRGVYVSPDGHNLADKRKREDDFENRENSKRRRRNPFATNIKKSPGKMLVKSPPAKPTLSRMSTFSAESRRIKKASKEFL